MAKLEFNEALNQLLNSCKPLTNVHYIPISEALDCVLASDIICQKNLPSFDNSAMDGYAFRYEDKEDPLRVKKSILAGDDIEPSLEKNECYKIMTGAKIPNDADTIVELEKTTTLDEDRIMIIKDVKYQNAYRFKGEESKKGEILLQKQTHLSASHIMLLASQGITHVSVYLMPKVVVISTGSELKEPWECADESSIFNANTSGVLALLKRFGFDANYGGIVPDDLSRSTQFIKSLYKSYDMIITTGGVSMGEADFVLRALENNGFKKRFHGVNIRPGHPLLCGVLEDTLVISLPGNPMATYLNAFLFAVVALKKLSHLHPSHIKHKAKNLTTFSFKKGRTNVILGSYENGTFKVTNDNKFGSGMITPITQSNAITLSDPQNDTMQKGEEIEIILL